MVDAVLRDWRTAPIGEKLRVTLAFLEHVTLSPSQVIPADVQPLLDAGVSVEAIEDALIICASFNIIARIADAFDVAIPSMEGFERTADFLLSRGYI